MPHLDLEYATRLSPELIYQLERAAHCVGLPLRELELLGQEPSHAEAFVSSVDLGRETEFLEHVDWQRLEDLLYDRGPQRLAADPNTSNPWVGTEAVQGAATS